MSIPMTIQKFLGFSAFMPGFLQRSTVKPVAERQEPPASKIQAAAAPPVETPAPASGGYGAPENTLRGGAVYEGARAVGEVKLVGKQDLERFENGVGREFELLVENLKLMKEVQQSQYQSEAQRKFLAMVAHDAQNPLAAILGYAEFLGSKLEGLPTESRCAANIASAATMLQQLITDLMDMAALETGKFRINPKPIDMTEIVKDVLSRMQVTASERNIQMLVDIPKKLPQLMGDPFRLEQVIQNLCSNAVQYTPKGGTVTVRAELLPETLVVSVTDTGIGISKEDLPHVFERYYRGRASREMRPAGFGLGLEISREIVQRHGGEIGVDSEVGRGSRFFFKLPIRKPQ